MTASTEFHCHFCGRYQHEVEVLVVGPVNIGICNSCVDTAAETVQRKRDEVMAKRDAADCSACDCQLPPGVVPNFAAVSVACPVHGDGA